MYSLYRQLLMKSLNNVTFIILYGYTDGRYMNAQTSCYRKLREFLQVRRLRNGINGVKKLKAVKTEERLKE